MTDKAKPCKDCAPGSKRPAPHPGPRCATHAREWRRRNRQAAHGRRLQQVYSLTAEEYAEILEAQGGTCYICQRATGASKRLSVDHDHDHCDGPTSCGMCVRGLLCQTCNRLLGHLRDDPLAFLRGANYLWQWPSGRGPEDREQMRWIRMTVKSFRALVAAGFGSKNAATA